MDLDITAKKYRYSRMNGLQKINRYFSDLGGRRFLDTQSALEVRQNFFEAPKADIVFLRPQNYMIDAVYEQFKELKTKIDPKHLRALEMTATFDKGELIDLHTMYRDLKKPTDINLARHSVLAERDALPLLETFSNIVAPCIKGDYLIKLYGGRVDEISTRWHKDETTAQDWYPSTVGVLALDKTNQTTRFPGKLGDISAPEHSICFIGKNVIHRDAEEERPTLQIASM